MRGELADARATIDALRADLAQETEHAAALTGDLAQQAEACKARVSVSRYADQHGERLGKPIAVACA